MPLPRFAVFVPNLENGPIQRSMVALANGLQRRSLAVDVVAPMGGGPLRAALDGGIGQIDLAKRHTTTSVLALARILAERRPVGLVSPVQTAGPVAIVASFLARTGTPVVVVDTQAMDRNQSALHRVLLARATAIVHGADDVEAIAAHCLAAFSL
ncbi:hypothetical protein [Azospirillum sp. sgz302134]